MRLEELITSVGGVAAPRPEPVDQTDLAWRILAGDWPPFEPPAKLPPPKRLTIDWLSQTLWGKERKVPTAGELLRKAAAYDAEFPESQDARRRREQPDWVVEELDVLTEYVSEERWQRIEHLFDTANSPRLSATEQRRIAWLRAHEDAIRPALEAAKAEHFRRYGIGSFWYQPDATGAVAAWKRDRWPAEVDRWKVPRGLCTRWTRTEDAAAA
jgi:hypothetical protein